LFSQKYTILVLFYQFIFLNFFQVPMVVSGKNMTIFAQPAVSLSFAWKETSSVTKVQLMPSTQSKLTKYKRHKRIE
tara:strand:+ start:451 stop:678 length:228 start_codon:yes stop_codon:yes gene_type:complete